MQITMLGEYAIRTIVHLATCGENTVVHIREISARWSIPESFLRKIIPKLNRAGFIGTIRGNNGGIYLNRPADSITPLDIIESVEGEISLNRCVLFPAECRHSEYCSMHSLWQEARIQLRKILSSQSIDELVQKNLNDINRRDHDKILNLA